MDRDRLLEIFAEELADLLQELEHGLLELGEGPPAERRTEIVRELFRSAHSLKGAAHSVGAGEVATIAHELEDAFAQLREDPVGPQAPRPETLLATVDRLAATAARLSAGAPPGTPAGTDESDGAGPGNQQVSAGRQVGPPRARVPVSDLEEGIVRAGELRLAAERVTVVEREVAVAMSTVRGMHDRWQRLKDALASDDRGAPQASTRVAVDRLDDALEGLAARTGAVQRRMSDADRQLQRSTTALTEAVQRLGMVRFEEVCAGLDRAVRDIAADSGKRARLVISSGDLELDRSVATALREPLVHLVRNAVHHGIEPPAVRQAAGKPQTGRVHVAGEVRSGEIVVTVSDDGAGIDPDAVRAAARRHGIAAPTDDEDAIRLLFTAGLSTASAVTDVSGRGVGLDVVRADVEAVGGTARLTSVPDDGTTVTLILPLTLSTMRAVLVEAGGEWVAVPVTAVDRVLRVAADDIVHVDGRDTVTVDERSVVLADLGRTLGFASSLGERDELPALVVRTTEGSVAFVVDAVRGDQEITLRTLGPRLHDAPGLLGGVVLADGTCGFLLHAPTWVRRAMQGAATTEGIWHEAAAARSQVLLAEDTLTTRALERSILEAAGYRVTVAADGAEAWRLLQRHGADVVVTDVDMPQMNGLELCERIRSSDRFSDLPVILVTSLADDEDRARGLEVGANAYFVKSAFDQDALLDEIARLL